METDRSGNIVRNEEVEALLADLMRIQGFVREACEEMRAYGGKIRPRPIDDRLNLLAELPPAA